MWYMAYMPVKVWNFCFQYNQLSALSMRMWETPVQSVGHDLCFKKINLNLEIINVDCVEIKVQAQMPSSCKYFFIALYST